MNNPITASMVAVAGVLAVRVIHGRNGDFSVGTLTCPLGEFVVKDAELDQFAPGSYTGTFGISKIWPHTYAYGGKLVVEQRAKVEAYQVNEDEDVGAARAAVPPPAEPDPADEPAAPPVAAPVETAPAAEAEKPAEPPTPEDDQALFGTLWPIGATVKLDPTIDRKRFRNQRNRLKEMGYGFEADNQIWRKAA